MMKLYYIYTIQNVNHKLHVVLSTSNVARMNFEHVKFNFNFK